MRGNVLDHKSAFDRGCINPFLFRVEDLQRLNPWLLPQYRETLGAIPGNSTLRDSQQRKNIYLPAGDNGIVNEAAGTGYRTYH